MNTPLRDGYSAVELDQPRHLLGSEYDDLRAQIITVSDQAFGRPTATRWEHKFTPEYLGILARFFVLTDRDGAVVGWSGYRAATIAGERVVYFTSTGLAPRCQGAHLVPALQHIVVRREARRHPLRPVVTAVRTRNPHSYHLAVHSFGKDPVIPTLDGSVDDDRLQFVASVGRWLGLATFDPTTAIDRGAYGADDPLYGHDPRSGDPTVDDLFARLGPSDAYLLMGRRSRAEALRLAITTSGGLVP